MLAKGASSAAASAAGKTAFYGFLKEQSLLHTATVATKATGIAYKLWGASQFKNMATTLKFWENMPMKSYFVKLFPVFIKTNIPITKSLAIAYERPQFYKNLLRLKENGVFYNYLAEKNFNLNQVSELTIENFLGSSSIAEDLLLAKKEFPDLLQALLKEDIKQGTLLNDMSKAAQSEKGLMFNYFKTLHLHSEHIGPIRFKFADKDIDFADLVKQYENHQISLGKLLSGANTLNHASMGMEGVKDGYEMYMEWMLWKTSQMVFG